MVWCALSFIHCFTRDIVLCFPSFFSFSTLQQSYTHQSHTLTTLTHQYSTLKLEYDTYQFQLREQALETKKIKDREEKSELTIALERHAVEKIEWERKTNQMEKEKTLLQETIENQKKMYQEVLDQLDFEKKRNTTLLNDTKNEYELKLQERNEKEKKWNDEKMMLTNQLMEEQQRSLLSTQEHESALTFQTERVMSLQSEMEAMKQSFKNVEMLEKRQSTLETQVKDYRLQLEERIVENVKLRKLMSSSSSMDQEIRRSVSKMVKTMAAMEVTEWTEGLPIACGIIALCVCLLMSFARSSS